MDCSHRGSDRMIGLIQRVTEASVTVEEQIIGSIGAGLLVLVGVQSVDNELSMQRLLKKILAYRVFSDDAGKMNLSLTQTGGGLLLVPQFTLAADTRKGLRPGFSSGASPDQASQLFSALVEEARGSHPLVESGQFAADMQVRLVNDGPVTFWLEV